MQHGDAGHQAEGEDEVGEGASEGDEDALPAGMRVEVAGIGGRFAGIVAGHLDVAAEGEQGDAVVGVAAAKPKSRLPKPMEKTSTRMPQSLATAKWPNSCTRTMMPSTMASWMIADMKE